MKPLKIILSTIVLICLIVTSAVSFHSVFEIHYLKNFYPKSFTVVESFYATLVELVKVFLVSFPLLLIIIICLITYLIFRKRKK